jgi:curved DNA-binding protein CbpA
MNKNLFAIALVISTVFGLQAHGQKADAKVEPQTFTLFSRIKYKDQDYGRSAFNFQHGVRSDGENWSRRFNGDLLYGNISICDDTDWFSVSGGDDPSRIKDLGELGWSDIYYTPFLPANARMTSGIKFPGPGESFESSSDGQVSRVVTGHMYLVHIKNRESNLYAMFRVEALEPSDHCTISWKIVPSPEN